jgi:short-subunit dehydrogenase
VTDAGLSRYGPWALVAGGSDGLGAAFATRIAADGVNLLLAARRPEPLEEMAAALRAQHGVEVRTVAADLCDPAGIAAIATAAEGLEIGLLVCNAGSEAQFGDFLDDPDLGRTKTVVALNIMAPAALIHHFARPMRDRGRGGVLLVGSMAGFAGSPRIAAYAGAKAFVHVFAEGLWEELRPHGVDAMAFVLGAADTPTMRRSLGMTVPGLADPAELAAEALAQLGSGPLHIHSAKQQDAARLRGEDRRAAVALTAQGAAMLDAIRQRAGGKA